MRALISVYDKHGVDLFAGELAGLGYEIVSSGGTAAFLEEHGLPVTRVEDITGAPEVLGGRVKTLHPRIHAGILARRDLERDVETLAAEGIEPFDLVCVNLYPFSSVAGRIDIEEADVIEMIDVGGPARGSRPSTAKSANFPALMEPLRASSKAAKAAFFV